VIEVAELVTARAVRRLTSRSLLIDALQIADQVVRELEPGRGHRRISDDAGEDLDRLSCRDFLAEPAGHHLAQHSVQPTHHLGAEPAQIAVAPRPHPQHHRVVVKARFAHLT
jgi:hypothetical protein